MISSMKTEALKVLADLCELAPDIRLGQLFAHLGFLAEDQAEKGLWDIDDERLVTILLRHRSEMVARTSPKQAMQRDVAGSTAG
jgi:hypothetical protein